MLDYLLQGGGAQLGGPSLASDMKYVACRFRERQAVCADPKNWCACLDAGWFPAVLFLFYFFCF